MNKLMSLAFLSPIFLLAQLQQDPLLASSNPTNKPGFKKVRYSDPVDKKQPALIPSYNQHYLSIIELGANYTHASQKIKDQPLYHGNLGGAQASYEYQGFNDLYMGLLTTYKQGTLDNTKGHRSFLYIDVHQRIGYSYATGGKRWIGSFYTGVGYRHYGQTLKQDQTTIQFDYNTFYIPLGVKANYYFNTWIVGSLNFMWMPQVNSTVKIDPLKGARWSLEKSLVNLKVELPLTFFFTENRRYSVCLKPFYEYWEDGKTTAKLENGTVLGLPGNTYNFWGAELNFGFSF